MDIEMGETDEEFELIEDAENLPIEISDLGPGIISKLKAKTAKAKESEDRQKQKNDLAWEQMADEWEKQQRADLCAVLVQRMNKACAKGKESVTVALPNVDPRSAIYSTDAGEKYADYKQCAEQRRNIFVGGVISEYKSMGLQVVCPKRPISKNARKKLGMPREQPQENYIEISWKQSNPIVE